MNNNHGLSNVLCRLMTILVAPLLLIMIAQPVQASLSVGVEMQSASWDVTPPGSQPNYDANGLQLGFNVKIKFYKFYTGVNYLGGQFDFDSRNVPGIATVNPDSKVTRTEWNAVAGYYVFPYLSLFAKYKSLDFDNGANYRLTNPGVGAQLHYALSSHWLLFGNVARFAGNFMITGNNEGDTDISEYELGVAYRPALHKYFNISIKNQKLEYDYDNNGTETHRLQGLYVSYNYVF